MAARIRRFQVARVGAALWLVAVLLVGAMPRLHAALDPGTLPPLTLRFRCVTLAGEAPPADAKMRFHLPLKGPEHMVIAPKPVARAEGQEPLQPALSTDWSAPLTVGPEEWTAILKLYPNLYQKRWPAVIKLRAFTVQEPTTVEAELRFTETPDAPPQLLRWNLYGETAGLLVWREADGSPAAATMRDYNRRFWAAMGEPVKPAERPQHFPIVDRFIPSDNDVDALREGVHGLANGGFSAIMTTGGKRIRDMLLETGVTHTAGAVYNPPGYAFDYDPKVTEESFGEWAEKQAKPFREAGYEATDMVLYGMSDEPGWYYPQQYAALKGSERGLARFHQYLRDQGLAPADLGAADWAAVGPIGRAEVTDLASKRLFYWTQRFFPWDSARHFAKSTRALEASFYEGVPTTTNWNFFSGRSYVPGPVANNGAKKNPNAGMGGHDWLEFGRMRGSTMLWTEDWFGDEQAPQWSFYAAKLRSAAERGGVQFGGYVIPRTAGSRTDGILQKTLCLIGSGGKALKYFVFGPEYAFPGNCYSFKAELLPTMARSHRMIAQAEEVLWPGTRPAPEVAILMPRSSQMWDATEIEIPTAIYDATNTHLNRRTVDYMAEVADLYTALQHANIPTDFLEEQDLMDPAMLARYKAIYVTAPDLPVAAQNGVLNWVEAGGHLVTTSGAMHYDEYHEPTTVFDTRTGLTEARRERLLVADLFALQPLAQIANAQQRSRPTPLAVYGVKGALNASATKAETLMDFLPAGDAALSPAVVDLPLGKGSLRHFALMPGMSYVGGAKLATGRLPEAFSAELRDLIIAPAVAAGVAQPARALLDGKPAPLIETPLLLSEAGAAITLLNWRNDPVTDLDVALPLDLFGGRGILSVRSVTLGDLAVTYVDGQARIRVPTLAAADILVMKPGR